MGILVFKPNSLKSFFKQSFVISGVFSTLITGIAQNSSHTTAQKNVSPQNSSQSSDTTNATKLVDSYLDQILCSSADFKLWKEGLYQASKAPIDSKEIEKAFSENLYYSLMPGQERSIFKDKIPVIYSETTRITEELKDIAVFFSHTIHDLFEKENKRLSDLKKPAITKEDFLLEFGKGSLNIKNESGEDYKSFIEQKIGRVVASTKKLKYGCSGNQNFIYRAGSRLGSVIDLDAFVIPATKISVASQQKVENNFAKTQTIHETKSTPRALLLADDSPETIAHAESIAESQQLPKKEEIRKAEPVTTIRKAIPVPQSSQARTSQNIQKTAKQKLQVQLQDMVGATFYFTPQENDPRYKGGAKRNIYDTSGNAIATVSSKFYEALKMQGAGVLANGKTVNFVSQSRSGLPRFKLTDSKYGLGKSSNALKPWKSIAIDANYYKDRGILVEVGQKVFIPSTRGLKIPGSSPVQFHDGYWEIADKGGAIKGARIDMFTGHMHWKEALEYVNIPSNYSSGKTNNEAKKLGDKRHQITMQFVK